MGPPPCRDLCHCHGTNISSGVNFHDVCYATHPSLLCSLFSYTCDSHIVKLCHALSAIHPGVKGPSSYPANPCTFFDANDINVEPEDAPINSQISKHALCAAVSSVRFRKKKQPTSPIAPTTRRLLAPSPLAASSSSPSLNIEDGIANLARYVVGDIQSWSPHWSDLSASKLLPMPYWNCQSWTVTSPPVTLDGHVPAGTKTEDGHVPAATNQNPGRLRPRLYQRNPGRLRPRRNRCQMKPTAIIAMFNALPDQFGLLAHVRIDGTY